MEGILADKTMSSTVCIFCIYIVELKLCKCILFLIKHFVINISSVFKIFVNCILNYCVIFNYLDLFSTFLIVRYIDYSIKILGGLLLVMV